MQPMTLATLLLGATTLLVQLACTTAAGTPRQPSVPPAQPSSCDAPRPPLIILPGIMASQINASYNGLSASSPCVGPRKSHTIWPPTASAIAPTGLPCWMYLVQTAYQPQKQLFENNPGVTVTVDPGGPTGTGYGLWKSSYSNLTNYLTAEFGYQAGRDMLGAPFDWRLHLTGMDSRGQTDSLARKVEAAVAANCGRKAVLIGHSMGGLVAFHLLHRNRTWTQQYVAGLITVSAPFGGTADQAIAVRMGAVDFNINEWVKLPMQRAAADVAANHSADVAVAVASISEQPGPPVPHPAAAKGLRMSRGPGGAAGGGGRVQVASLPLLGGGGGGSNNSSGGPMGRLGRFNMDRLVSAYISSVFFKATMGLPGLSMLLPYSSAYGFNRRIVLTRRRTYTAGMMRQLMADIGDDVTDAAWQQVHELDGLVDKGPLLGIPTHCIYAGGKDTTLTWSFPNIARDRPLLTSSVLVMSGGDGTVGVQSLRQCYRVTDPANITEMGDLGHLELLKDRRGLARLGAALTAITGLPGSSSGSMPPASAQLLLGPPELDAQGTLVAGDQQQEAPEQPGEQNGEQRQGAPLPRPTATFRWFAASPAAKQARQEQLLLLQQQSDTGVPAVDSLSGPTQSATPSPASPATGVLTSAIQQQPPAGLPTQAAQSQAPPEQQDQLEQLQQQVQQLQQQLQQVQQLLQQSKAQQELLLLEEPKQPQEPQQPELEQPQNQPVTEPTQQPQPQVQPEQPQQTQGQLAAQTHVPELQVQEPQVQETMELQEQQQQAQQPQQAQDAQTAQPQPEQQKTQQVLSFEHQTPLQEPAGQTGRQQQHEKPKQEEQQQQASLLAAVISVPDGDLTDEPQPEPIKAEPGDLSLELTGHPAGAQAAEPDVSGRGSDSSGSSSEGNSSGSSLGAAQASNQQLQLLPSSPASDTPPSGLKPSVPSAKLPTQQDQQQQPAAVQQPVKLDSQAATTQLASAQGHQPQEAPLVNPTPVQQQQQQQQPQEVQHTAQQPEGEQRPQQEPPSNQQQPLLPTSQIVPAPLTKQEQQMPQANDNDDVASDVDELLRPSLLQQQQQDWTAALDWPDSLDVAIDTAAASDEEAPAADRIAGRDSPNGPDGFITWSSSDDASAGTDTAAALDLLF